MLDLKTNYNEIKVGEPTIDSTLVPLNFLIIKDNIPAIKLHCLSTAQRMYNFVYKENTGTKQRFIAMLQELEAYESFLFYLLSLNLSMEEVTIDDLGYKYHDNT